MNTSRVVLFLFSYFVIATACNKNKDQSNIQARSPNPTVNNVIIVVVDGPRYSETWGDSTHQYIPHLFNDMASNGIAYTNFFNDGPTYTNAGHTAITTGYYQEINNTGKELPDNPSIFQYWLKQTGKDSTKAWVIASKDKLEILTNCKDVNWNNQYMPASNCGVSGNGSGYRGDSTTYDTLISVLKTYQPNLLLVNFKEPDHSGHLGDWNAYLNGIKSSDYYVFKLWKFLKSDSHYKDNTILFVTNDHGRHLDGIANGFTNHGDTCAGCRHINLFVTGTGVKQGIVENKRRGQVDLSTTIIKLLGINMPPGSGSYMDELFIPLDK